MFKITYITYNKFKQEAFAETKEEVDEMVKELRKMNHVTEVWEPEKI